jgi:hypothetical protein
MTIKRKNSAKTGKVAKRPLTEEESFYGEIANLRDRIETKPALRVDIYTNEWHYNVAAFWSDLREF